MWTPPPVEEQAASAREVVEFPASRAEDISDWAPPGPAAAAVPVGAKAVAGGVAPEFDDETWQ